MAGGGIVAAVPSLSSTSHCLLGGMGGATVPLSLSSTDGMAALWPLSLSWLCRWSLRYQCVKTRCNLQVWVRVRAGTSRGIPVLFPRTHRVVMPLPVRVGETA